MDSGLSSPVSTLSPRRLRSRFTCRRLEKLCCLAAGYFPLFFVYSLMLWAIYTEVYSISWRAVGGWQGLFSGILGVLLCGMALWSYTFAVFTSPGSPLDKDNKHAYSHLPTSETSALNSTVTVKADGQERFCKKCLYRKPDRTHHCSSCRTCVLKMDHHCPWLANCLGLRNYKAFLLFLIYTSLFCLLCFAVSCRLVYTELFVPDARERTGENRSSNMDDLTPVNWVLLAVISGIVGLVLSGFTIWHLSMTSSNMTTIESLEKVRYTAPSLRNGTPPPSAHLVGLNSQYQHEVNRYSNYLLEESSKKLPHAFDLGRMRNFAQVFGGRDKMWLWCFPMFSGVGDGWTWETSRKWEDAALALKAERDKWLREQGERERAAGWGYDPAEEQAWNRGNPEGLVKYAGGGSGGGRKQSKADRLLGRPAGAYTDTDGAMPLRKLTRPASPHIISEGDDETDDDMKDLEASQGSTRKPFNNKKSSEDTNGDVEWGTWGD